MSYVFISYSKDDTDFARHLRSLLVDGGFAVWMDETRLIPGQRWWRVIEQHIKQAAILLVIMSPRAEQSKWVEREILVAENNGVPILPVLYRGNSWSSLANIQYQDMTHGMAAALPSGLEQALVSAGLKPGAVSQASQPASRSISIRISSAITRTGCLTRPISQILLIPLLIAVVPALVQTWPDIVKLLAPSASTGTASPTSVTAAEGPILPISTVSQSTPTPAADAPGTTQPEASPMTPALSPPASPTLLAPDHAPEAGIIVEAFSGIEFAYVPADVQSGGAVGDFWIMVYEVSNGQFADYLNTRLYPASTLTESGRLPIADFASEQFHVRFDTQWVAEEGFQSYPAIMVTWFGAEEFCDTLGFSLPLVDQLTSAGATTAIRTAFSNEVSASSEWTSNVNNSVVRSVNQFWNMNRALERQDVGQVTRQTTRDSLAFRCVFSTP